MMDYNKQAGQQAQAGGWGETAKPDYAEWARQLRDYADQITDPRLAGHADRLADLAEQTAGLAPRAQAEMSATPQPTDLPSSAREYSRIAKEFDDNLVALDGACPG